MKAHRYIRTIGRGAVVATTCALLACSGSSAETSDGPAGEEPESSDAAPDSGAVTAPSASGGAIGLPLSPVDAGLDAASADAGAAGDAGSLGDGDGGIGACSGASTALDGVPDPAHVSGQAPPTCTPHGFTRAYVDDFPGSSLASGWTLPSSFQYGAGWVSSSMVTVHDGLLDIGETYSGKSGDEPVVGWAQLTNTPAALLTYGKLLVRQRADVFEHVELATLTWPVAQNVWPPEVDFVEDDDGDRHWYAFNHYKDASGKNQQTYDDSGLTSSDWHTWGIEWTPAAVTYTRDGAVWKTETDPRLVPSIQMYLGFVMATHTQPKPGSAHWQMDWVALYAMD